MCPITRPWADVRATVASCRPPHISIVLVVGSAQVPHLVWSGGFVALLGGLGRPVGASRFRYTRSGVDALLIVLALLKKKAPPKAGLCCTSESRRLTLFRLRIGEALLTSTPCPSHFHCASCRWALCWLATPGRVVLFLDTLRTISFV